MTPQPTIAWQDEHLLVVDKPAGLVVHPARGHREGTLSQLLKDTVGGVAGGDSGSAGNRAPSGSRHIWAARSRPQRGGPPTAAGGSARTPDRARIPCASRGTAASAHRHNRGADPGATRGFARAWPLAARASREARTHFTLERSLPSVSLLRLRLDTGRTHQIRVHLQAIGHPVCGDPEYGTADMLGLTAPVPARNAPCFPAPDHGRAKSRSTRHCLRMGLREAASSGRRPVPAVHNHNSAASDRPTWSQARSKGAEDGGR